MEIKEIDDLFEAIERLENGIYELADLIESGSWNGARGLVHDAMYPMHDSRLCKCNDKRNVR